MKFSIVSINVAGEVESVSDNEEFEDCYVMSDESFKPNEAKRIRDILNKLQVKPEVEHE